MSAVAKEEGQSSERAVEVECSTTQYMIDTNAKKLFALRTQCRTTEETIQKEIFETEVNICADVTDLVQNAIFDI